MPLLYTLEPTFIGHFTFTPTTTTRETDIYFYHLKTQHSLGGTYQFESFYLKLSLSKFVFVAAYRNVRFQEIYDQISSHVVKYLMLIDPD